MPNSVETQDSSVSTTSMPPDLLKPITVTPPPSGEVVQIDEQDIELDYTSLEALARVEIPDGIDWSSAIRSTKSYQEVYNLQYELDFQAEQ